MSDNEQNRRYIYGMRNRPPFIGTCPEGYTALEDPTYTYGCVAYDAPLSPEDVYRYELIPASPDAYPVAVGDTVIVNEVDDATVIGFEAGGFVKVRYCFDDSTEVSVIWRNVEKRAALEAAPEPDVPRDHSMDCYRKRLTAQYAEHAQPAVDRADPAESNLAAYAEMMQGHAQESEARALAAEERADAAEWAVGELRAALEGLLESGCVDYVNPHTDDTSCAVCGAVSRHPIHHAAGCAVRVAEDALGDTEDVGKRAGRYRALYEAARAMIERGPHYSHYNTSIERLDALRAALAALEGESHE